MKIIRQLITDLIDTNLTETWLPWDSTKTYNIGDPIVVESGTDPNGVNGSFTVARKDNYYYRTVIDGNLNQDPATYLNSKWTFHRVSNRYAAIDLQSQTRSVSIGADMYMTFRRGLIERLAFGNVTADSMLIELLDTDGVTVLHTITVPGGGVSQTVYDYWTYLYEPYSDSTNLQYLIEIPPIGTFIKVTFLVDGVSGEAACGFMVGGKFLPMGDTLYGVNFKFNSFSTKEFDAFGLLKMTKRGVQDLVDFETEIDNGSFSIIRTILKELYDEVVVFVLDESDDSQYENLITLGTVMDSSQILSNAVTTTVSWSVAEVI